MRSLITEKWDQVASGWPNVPPFIGMSAVHWDNSDSAHSLVEIAAPLKLPSPPGYLNGESSPVYDLMQRRERLGAIPT
jgi:hypothetical protein